MTFTWLGCSDFDPMAISFCGRGLENLGGGPDSGERLAGRSSGPPPRWNGWGRSCTIDSKVANSQDGLLMSFRLASRRRDLAIEQESAFASRHHLGESCNDFLCRNFHFFDLIKSAQKSKSDLAPVLALQDNGSRLMHQSSRHECHLDHRFECHLDHRFSTSETKWNGTHHQQTAVITNRNGTSPTVTELLQLLVSLGEFCLDRSVFRVYLCCSL